MVEEGGAVDRARAERGRGRSFFYNLAQLQSFQLVFFNKSRRDKRIGYRRTWRSPFDVAPVRVARFHRNQRRPILPACTHDGIIFFSVLGGVTEGVVFADFLKQLLLPPH